MYAIVHFSFAEASTSIQAALPGDSTVYYGILTEHGINNPTLAKVFYITSKTDYELREVAA
jgi:hypothetical protein